MFYSEYIIRCFILLLFYSEYVRLWRRFPLLAHALQPFPPARGRGSCVCTPEGNNNAQPVHSGAACGRSRCHRGGGARAQPQALRIAMHTVIARLRRRFLSIPLEIAPVATQFRHTGS